MNCLVAALTNLHKNRIIHRDICPSNIMLHVKPDRTHPIKTDYGLPKTCYKNPSESCKRDEVYAYNSPEQYENKLAGRKGIFLSLINNIIKLTFIPWGLCY